MRSAAMTDVLELTDENVELVLDEIRPYLMAGLQVPHSCMHACMHALFPGAFM